LDGVDGGLLLVESPIDVEHLAGKTGTDCILFLRLGLRRGEQGSFLGSRRQLVLGASTAGDH
jgi:hypothetical protein